MFAADRRRDFGFVDAVERASATSAPAYPDVVAPGAKFFVGSTSYAATIVEEKETNAIRGAWCAPPVASLDHRWIYQFHQQQLQERHYQRKNRRNHRQLNRRHHNNNNESPPNKKAMPMLLHPPPNLAQHELDSPQPLDFSVSGGSRYNGHVDPLRIAGGGDVAGDGVGGNGPHQSLQEADNCSDAEYAVRTSGSSSVSATSDEGSLVHSPSSPDPNENRMYHFVDLGLA